MEEYGNEFMFGQFYGEELDHGDAGHDHEDDY